jgi:hypothetical protein
VPTIADMGDGFLFTPTGDPDGGYAVYAAALVCIEESARALFLLCDNKSRTGSPSVRRLRYRIGTASVKRAIYRLTDTSQLWWVQQKTLDPLLVLDRVLPTVTPGYQVPDLLHARSWLVASRDDRGDSMSDISIGMLDHSRLT